MAVPAGCARSRFDHPGLGKRDVPAPCSIAEIAKGNMTGPISSPRQMVSTRRWPRFHVHLPVFIAAETADSEIAIPGLVSAISRAGMEVYGGVPLQPGDLMEVEFRTSGMVRVAGIVRNRSGYCFGLEF